MNQLKMPQQGDVIEVRDKNDQVWNKRHFVSFYMSSIFCLELDETRRAFLWQEWRWPQEEAPVQTKDEVKSTEDVNAPTPQISPKKLKSLIQATQEALEKENYEFINKQYKKLTDPKPSFPPPPPGREWQNPDNLTPEQVEIDKGWRLKLKGERWLTLEIWNNQRLEWVDYGNCSGDIEWATYRTKHPLPVEKIPDEETPLSKAVKLSRGGSYPPEQKITFCTKPEKALKEIMHPTPDQEELEYWHDKCEKLEKENERLVQEIKKPTPLPVEPKMVPLEAKDWKGVWFVKEFYSEEWHLVAGLSDGGLSLLSFYRIPFDQLKDNWLRSRDCVEWHRCEKSGEEL